VSSSERLMQGLLRCVEPLKSLRSLPILGDCVGWLGNKIVPRSTRIWAQVEAGPAAGIWLRLNPRVALDTLRGRGEPQVQEAMLAYLRPGMTFYDLGANIGFFSLLAARLVGEQGRVIAFEADPEIAARLREHIERSQFRWVTVVEKAVWSEASRVLFERIDPETSPDRGLGHVVGEAPANSSGRIIEIEAVALDDFTRTAPAPDFIKCDVEGAEVEVFRGAQRLLAEGRPRILCEIHSESNREALLADLKRFGYVWEDGTGRQVLASPQ
jgi:FkbM family methyltransferase